MKRSLAGLAAFLGLSMNLWAQDPPKEASDDEAKKAVEEFKKALKKPKLEEGDIVSALIDLGSKQHTKLILPEIKPWLTKGGTEIRLTAAEMLSKYKKNKTAAEAILAALAAQNQKEKNILEKFVSFAADTECKDIASKLCGLFGAKYVEVACAAVQGCGKIKSKNCIEPLIKLVADLEDVNESNVSGAGQPNMPGPGAGGQGQEDERIKRKRELLQPALASLRETTGEKYTRAKAKQGESGCWYEWWGKNKATFKDPT